MTSTITIKKGKAPQKILVEIDADKFERLAANLGFFGKDFLKALGRSLKDETAGRVRKISSLKELSA